MAGSLETCRVCFLSKEGLHSVSDHYGSQLIADLMKTILQITPVLTRDKICCGCLSTVGSAYSLRRNSQELAQSHQDPQMMAENEFAPQSLDYQQSMTFCHQESDLQSNNCEPVAQRITELFQTNGGGDSFASSGTLSASYASESSPLSFSDDSNEGSLDEEDEVYYVITFG